MTPFNFGKIVKGPDFTNREKETSFLISRLNAGTNCMLISPRRWGKSSLVQHTSQKMKKQNSKLVFCFIDMYNVRSEKEFYELFSKEILKSIKNIYSIIQMHLSIRKYKQQTKALSGRRQNERNN